MDTQTRQILAVIALTVIAVLVLAVFGWILFHISSYAEEGKESVKATQMITYKNLADTYYARLGFYDGLCENIGVGDEYACEASDEQYRITIPAREGMLCVDAENPVRYHKQLPASLTCR